MKFIDLAENGNNSPLTYVSGILLIFVLYFLGSLGILVDIHLNFPSLSIESMDAQFYQTMGHTRFLFWVLFPYLLVFIGVLLHHRWMHHCHHPPPFHLEYILSRNSNVYKKQKNALYLEWSSKSWNGRKEIPFPASF